VEYTIQTVYYQRQKTPEEILSLNLRKIPSLEKVFSHLTSREVIVLCLRFGLVGLDPRMIKPTKPKNSRRNIIK